MSEAVKGRAWDGNRGYFHRNLAVVIGIDLYQNDSIKDLSTAVSDARAIAHLLEQEYDYKQSDEKPEVIRLFDKDATLEALQHLFHTRIPQELNPRERDRLIIYYAGHGLPRSNDDGPEGYLVPHNADPTKPELFLAMRDVSEALSKLKCHHLLVILDCCFAGTFRWAGSRKAVPILETIRREHYYHFIRHPAWQVITSSAHDQEALDVARLKEDNRKPVPGLSEPHSPFALAILEGLQTGNDSQRVNADLYPDGVVTAHELFVYLQNRVKELSGERQNPGIFPLRQEYDKGEFIFTRPEFDPQNLAEALPLNEDNNPYRGLNSFDEKHARFFFGRQALIEELAKRLAQPNQALMVVLGVSGSGKSSLVKAGLIPYLRDQHLVQICLLELLIQFPPSPLKLRLMSQIYQWCILDPMRPGESPFMSLARTLLPIANDNLLERLAEVSFLDDIFQPMLKSEDESGRDSDKTAVGEQEGNPPATQPSLQADETLIKVADSWCSATPEAKLLLIEDYFAQLETLGNPQQKAQLKDLYDRILAELDVVSQQLQQEPYEYFSRAIATWSQKHSGVRLFLVIDQFEELLTRSQDDRKSSNQTQEQEGESTEQKEWQEFLEVLRIAIADHPQTLRLLLTLRSDFEPRFLTSTLEPHWKDARFPVRAMTSDELRQAIENPALKQALYFEELKDEKGNTIGNLVSKLVDEVGQMPGALPLLSFTLSELYVSLYRRWQVDRSTDRTLRFADYETLGGVAGALTRRATEEYDRLIQDKDPDDEYLGGFGKEEGKAYQATMRRVMLRMVAIEGGSVARRRVPKSELVYSDSRENERVEQVIQRLVKARLLVTGQEIHSRTAGKEIVEGYVEPAHDFLVRGWDELQKWIKEEHGYLALQPRLTPAANDWIRNNRVADYLWDNNPYLPLSKTVPDSENNWLNKVEAEFVAASSLENEKQLRRVTLRAKAAESRLLLPLNPVQGLVTAIEATGLAIPGFETEEVFSNIQTNLSEAVEKTRERNICIGHQGAVNSVALSQDGQLIVSGSSDKTVRLWDYQGNPTAPPFTGHDREIHSVAISSNTQVIASGGADGTIRLWDLKGNLIAPPCNHESGYRVFAVAFSPDGQVVASAGWDSTIRLWDLNGLLIANPFRYEHPFTSVAFSPDGQVIASGSSDGTILLWNLQGELINEPLRGHKSSVRSVAFNPDGSAIVSGSEDNTIRLWDLLSNSVGQPFTGHNSWVNSVAFSQDGQTIVSGSSDKTVRLWDLQGNLIVQPFRGHTSIVTSVAFSPDGLMIISGGGSEYISPEVPSNISTDYTVRFWDIQSNLMPLVIEHQGEVNSATISPDGKVIASASSSDNSTVHTVQLWDLQGNLITAPFKGHTGLISSVAFSPDGKVILSAGADGTLKLWDLEGNLIAPLMRHGDFVFCAVFSPDGQTIASGSIDQTWRLWNLQGQPLAPPFAGHDSAVNSIAFSPDSPMIVTGSGSFSDKDNTVRLWDLQGNQIALCEGHAGPITSVQFSPKEQMVISGSHDKTVRLWDLQGNQIAPPFWHEDGVRAVAFSPDGHMIVSGTGGIFAGPNAAVYLWDKRGNLIGQSVRHSGSVESVAFSRDGQIIISGSNDRTTRLWRVGWEGWLEVACDRLRHHPVFKNPRTEIEKSAYETCQEYVWSKLDLMLA